MTSLHDDEIRTVSGEDAMSRWAAADPDQDDQDVDADDVDADDVDVGPADAAG